MTQNTDDNRPTPAAGYGGGSAATGLAASDPTDTTQIDRRATDTQSIDPLDGIAAELDGLADLDPADAVPVLADITAELNSELDADTDRS